jgi:hypothetical protein
MQQNGCIRANENHMSQLNTRIPDAEFVQTGPMSCHFVSCCQGLMLAFKDPDITINAQSYYGILRDHCTTIKRKHAGYHHVAWCLSQCGLLYQEHAALHALGVGPSSIQPGSINAIVSSQTKTSMPRWWIGSSNSSLRRRSTGWCINGIPASMPWELYLQASTPLPRTTPNGFHLNRFSVVRDSCCFYHRPMVYDLPFGLCTGTGMGFVILHSYHTFFLLHNLQKCTSNSLPLRSCKGSWNERNKVEAV